ncbi:MAG: hypothetical protein GWM88_00745 [Pseudomonadales bacterium]|nr:hypothetical protein [Pseudomonadales bacterium]NIX06618.1 hypothetical protein [Pseudomonadales bacterium]
MRKTLLLPCMVLAANAWGECACFCADGALTTMCTTVAEAQAKPELCSARDPGACPAGALNEPRIGYASPEEGAINCRGARVWDADRATFADVRVCDVAP